MSKVFKACVVCFTGALSIGTRTEANKLVTSNGGEVSSSVTKKTTHLITNKATVSSKTSSVLKAIENGIFVLSDDWITDSVDKKKRQKEEDYVLVDTSDDADDDGDDDDDDYDDDDDDKKKKTKTKASSSSSSSSRPKRKAATKKKSKDDEDDEEEEGDEDGEEEEDDDLEAPSKKSRPNIVKVVTKGKYPVAPESGYDDHPSAKIYVDEHGNAFTCMLNQTNIKNNNNKFYQIQLIETGPGNYIVFQRWGRVGENGRAMSDRFGKVDKAIACFEKKFKSKTNNNWENRANFKPYSGKYTMIEVSYESDDDGDEGEDEGIFSEAGKKKRKEAEQIQSKLDPRVQDLISMISNIDTMKDTMKEFEIDLERLPLGNLSKSQIEKGYKVLQQIQKALDKSKANESDDDGSDDEESDDDFDDSLEALSSKFYTLIPHSFGRARPPVINNAAKLQKKIEMMQALSDMEIAQTLLQSTEAMVDINPIDAAYDSLKTELVPLDKDGEEYKTIADYVKNTHAATHNTYKLELLDVFTVARQGEKERYQKYANLHNKRLLWHGSRMTNFMGILSQGLRIAPPEAPATGYMFGKGIYWADMVSKSANYCFAQQSNNHGFMLLSEVALGDMYERLNADGSLPQTLPSKYHSTWGKGKVVPDPSMTRKLGDVEVPLGTPMNSGVRGAVLQYNEFIVYDVAQVNVKYMLKLKFNYR